MKFSSAKEIQLKTKDDGRQMEFLGKIIVDFSVAIEILKGHYGITDNFDIMKIKI